MGVAVVSSCDSAKILEAPEHTLDGVAVAVQVGREAVLPASVGLRWNVPSGPLLSILRLRTALSYLWLPKTSSSQMVTPELANRVIIREHAGTARTAGSLAFAAGEVAQPARS